MANLVSPDDDLSSTGTVVFPWGVEVGPAHIEDGTASASFHWRALMTSDGLARLWLGSNGQRQYSGAASTGRLIVLKAP